MFAGLYRGKKVLVTGHTGFKGSWLSEWLITLGADVAGLSDAVPTDPAHFGVAGLAGRMAHHTADIRDPEALRRVVHGFRPDFVFHLAAQAIVSTSYHDPLATLATNIMGTAHVLDVLRGVDWPVTAVLITSDKAYENVEWHWGYRENDRVGGKDIYSASKGAADIVISSFWRTYFTREVPHVRLGSGRAGNVIGGGDWARDRIVADCIRAWGQEAPVVIRAPRATRPWQHVLEPLSGYLALGAALAGDTQMAADLGGEAFNFGPRAEQNETVETLIRDLARVWGWNDPGDAYRVEGNQIYNEAGLLKLNCDKALALLKWQPTLDYGQCIDFTGTWYRTWHEGGDMPALTAQQITAYGAHAAARGIPWAVS
ncbi:MAG: CDP-glucose 4,6-dehydratase [Pseudomonadota bacterium]